MNKRKIKNKYILNLVVNQIVESLEERNKIDIHNFSIFNIKSLRKEYTKGKILLQVEEVGFTSKSRLSKYLKDINNIYQEGISVNIKTL